MKNILFLFAILLKLSSNAQITFVASFDSINYPSAKPLSSGGYIVAGSDYGSIRMLKLDAHANTIFKKKYEILSNYLGSSIIPTKFNEYAIAGNLSNSYFGGNDIFILKTDTNGIVLWNKVIGDSSGNCFISATQTFDKGFMVATRNCTYPYQYGCLTKIDSLGNITWSKKYDCEINNIEHTADSGYVFYASGGIVLKTNSLGIPIWQKKLKFVHDNKNLTYGTCKQILGGYLLQMGSTNSQSLYIIYAKIDLLGDTVWSSSSGFSGFGIANPSTGGAMVVAFDGSVFCTEAFSYTNVGQGTYSPVSVFNNFKTDSNGNRLHMTRYNNLSPTNNFVPTPDSCIMLFSENELIKTNKNGGLSGSCSQTYLTYGNNPLSLISIDTTITIWNSPFKDTSIIITSISDFNNSVSLQCTNFIGITMYSDNNSFAVYPNPNDGNMVIDYLIETDAKLEITDVTGKLIDSYNLSSLNKKLEIRSNEIVNGIYLYKIFINNQLLKTGKVTIIK